jgi:hypothetical protein
MPDGNVVIISGVDRFLTQVNFFKSCLKANQLLILVSDSLKQSVYLAQS